MSTIKIKIKKKKESVGRDFHVSWVLSTRRNGYLVLNKCQRTRLKPLSYHVHLHLQCSSLFPLYFPLYLLSFCRHYILYWWTLFSVFYGWRNCGPKMLRKLPWMHSKETGPGEPWHVGAFLFYLYHRAKQHHWQVLNMGRAKSDLHFEQDTLAAEWRMN